jgi:carbamoyl-phosphate synthase large subunit
MYSNYNILLYNSGGPATVGIIKSLKSINFTGKIIACDIDPLSAGSLMSDKNYVVPRTSDEDNFWKSIVDIISNESINLIIPSGHGSDFFAKRKYELEKMNVFLYMSDLEIIQLCENKYDFHNYILNSTISHYLPKLYHKGTIATLLELYKLDKSQFEFPIFVKPIFGGGSRGILACMNFDELCKVDKDNEFLFFEYLPGQEYSVDVMITMKNDIICISPRKRLQTKAGISTKGQIVIEPKINQLIEKMCEILRLKGPVCIQLKRDNDDNIKIVEVNPRFGGGTYFTTLAGCNFMKMILDDMNHVNMEKINPKSITIVRYFEEIVVQNDP